MNEKKVTKYIVFFDNRECVGENLCAIVCQVNDLKVDNPLRVD